MPPFQIQAVEAVSSPYKLGYIHLRALSERSGSFEQFSEQYYPIFNTHGIVLGSFHGFWCLCCFFSFARQRNYLLIFTTCTLKPIVGMEIRSAQQPRRQHRLVDSDPVRSRAFALPMFALVIVPACLSNRRVLLPQKQVSAQGVDVVARTGLLMVSLARIRHGWQV